MGKQIAIKVDNLSKVYKLYNEKTDRLKEALHPLRKQYHRDFFALNDISFEVYKGETVGIIGKNGSGKSTLLKIVTGLLTPTSGTIEVEGTVSALLELGAGFNPEYTGLENVYLNGMVLGFSRDEMDAKLDDILAFADIGDFIYQPVKMYSSGMFVRLAFAVAINVEPDILIVDEALAVGDVRFQQKCYRKINEFCERGKTILFCTHDTGAVLNFCSKCLWINDGRIKEMGLPDDIVKKYKAYMFYEQEVKALHGGISDKNAENINAATGITDITKQWLDVSRNSFFGDGGAEITQIAFFYNNNGQNIHSLKGGEKVTLGLKVSIFTTIDNPILGFDVKNSYGTVVFSINTFTEQLKIEKLNPGSNLEAFFTFVFPSLGNSEYSIDVAVADGTQDTHIQHCWKYDTLVFTVENQGEKYNFGYIYVDAEHIKIIR